MNTTEVNTQALEATANWWADKMQSPNNWNNGDNSPTGAMTFMLGNMLSSTAQQSITPEKIEKFKKYLVAILSELTPIERRGALDVDYHPSRALASACEHAGIDTSALPIKTFTLIDENFKVTGRYQYGGGWQTIYTPNAD